MRGSPGVCVCVWVSEVGVGCGAGANIPLLTLIDMKCNSSEENGVQARWNFAQGLSLTSCVNYTSYVRTGEPFT